MYKILSISIIFFTLSCGPNHPPIHAIWHNREMDVDLEINCKNEVFLPDYLSDSLDVKGLNLLYLEENSNSRSAALFIINQDDTIRLGTWHKAKTQLEIDNKIYTRSIIYVCDF